MAALRKLGEAPTSDDNELGEKRLFVLCAGPARQRALDQVCHRCLEHIDARRGLGACAEVLDEATVMEGAALSAGGVCNMYWAVWRRGLRSRERGSRLCFRGMHRGRESAAKQQSGWRSPPMMRSVGQKDRSRRATPPRSTVKMLVPSGWEMGSQWKRGVESDGEEEVMQDVSEDGSREAEQG